MASDIKLRLLSQRKTKCSVGLTGSIETVLSAAIDETNSMIRSPGKNGYSFGLGAIGNNFKSTKYRMGELLTTPNYTGVFTSGDVNEVMSQSGLYTRYYTPFNVSLGFGFNEYYSFEAERTFTYSAFYDMLFDISKRKRGFKGLISVSAIFEIDGFYGSYVKTAPLTGSISDGRIIDRGRFNDWFKVDTQPVYKGYRAIAAGLGFELKSSSFPDELLRRIFYIHPGNKNASERMLHNHCFILKPGYIPDNISDFNATVAGLLMNNEITDVKHILDNTTLRKGIVALGIIQEIVDIE